MDTIIESLPAFWHVWLVGSLLGIISLAFLFKFVFPAIKLGGELKEAIAKLSDTQQRLDGNLVELSEIAEGAMRTPDLAHSWSEYAETLHPQREVGEDGQSRIVRWRATALAETFFSEHAIVYTPLKADFYKHLPGILTGLGIIGTFLGLIMGLSSFDVSDPTKAQAELKSLINAVGHAFFVSGAAIALAMLFTWIEKSIVTARNRQVAKLRQKVDSLFDAGAGEEYLERIVRASETQATQAAHIKAALVADLREILTTLTERQLEQQSRHTAQVLQAQAEHSGRMSEDVGKAIYEHLGGPISDIAQAVKGVTANQGDAVNKMLTDVLAGFSAQMQDMFGGQMRGMTDLLKETSEAMRQSAERFASLAVGMDSAGKSTVEAMGERLNSAITSMEERQHVMNKQMGDFVMQIREMVSESQTESTRKLKETLGEVGEQVAGVVAELRRQAEASVESQGQREERFEESTGRAVQTLSAQMEGLLAQSVETNRSLQDSVAALLKETSEAMRQSAERFASLAVGMDSAGKSTVEAMGERLNSAITSMEERQHVMNTQMGDFVTQIREMVSESQTESTRKLKETLREVGEQVAGVVAELRRQANASAESQGQRQERFEESTGRVVQTLSAQMEGLLAQSVETNRSLQDSVAALSRATGEAISKLNQGAETLYVAASDFAKAGQGVSDTMRSATEATSNIKTASTTLVTATTATKDILADYARTSGSFAAMVAELRSVTEGARRDAALTSEIIGRIESAAQKLGDAQRQSEEYLKGVNDVLVSTHKSFAEHVGNTMRVANADFQKELRTAVDMVSAAVRDLSDTLEDAPGRGH